MSLYFIGEEQTLQHILKSREQRAGYQQYLLNKYENTIVSYKLNIPGPIKYNSLIKDIFDEGLCVFRKKLDENSIVVIEEKVLYKNSGPEYFAVFNVSACFIKKLGIYIEEKHPLGRIYDFDVLSADGKQLSREELGGNPRKCLVCKSNAFECGRSRRHPLQVLTTNIEQMASEYFKGHNKK